MLRMSWLPRSSISAARDGFLPRTRRGLTREPCDRCDFPPRPPVARLGPTPGAGLWSRRCQRREGFMHRISGAVRAISGIVLASALWAPAAAEEKSTKPRIAVIEFQGPPGGAPPAPLEIL